MRQKRQKWKRWMGIFLSILMVLNLMPGMSLTALAYDNNPYASIVGTATTVTFNGMPWYIIADNSTAEDAGTVTLLAADTSFGMSAFDSNGSSNAYASSDVKSMLDALTAEGGAFASVKVAIADTDLDDVGVTGAKLYLLSTSEAEPYANFYFTGAQYGEWWLRSPGNEVNYAAFVNGEEGNVGDSGTTVDSELGVRPALQLDLSNVFFDTDTNEFYVTAEEGNAEEAEGEGGDPEDAGQSDGSYTSYLPKDTDDADSYAAKLVNFKNRKWIIIEDNSNDTTAPYVTLLAADTSFGCSEFGSNNTYSTSTVKAYLDNIIAGTAGNGKPNFKNVANAILETENGKLYLLSKDENAALPEIVWKLFFVESADNGSWWLRSPGTERPNAAGYVDGKDGWYCEKTNGVSDVLGVRPALKLDLSVASFSAESKTFTVAGVLEEVNTPVISPVGGEYTGAQSVTISTTTEGATIYYTTDGSDPSTSSSVYSGAITVDASTTIKAIAVKEGMGDSEIASATYTIIVQTVDTPTFSPVADTYTEAQSVTISTTTEGATIYYTTDGTDPTTSSNVYSGAISLDATTTIKAIAVKEGMTNSDVASATYTILIPISGPVSYVYYTVNGTVAKKHTDGNCGEYTAVTSSDTTWGSEGNETWYVVTDTLTNDNRITVAGTVNLILCDGRTLTVSKGITVSEGNTLNIYAQSGGTGALTINNPSKYYPGIGGYEKAGGNITIHGGQINVTGGQICAGIGSGKNYSGGVVTIYDGTVNATGGSRGAGIGSGFTDNPDNLVNGGTLTIYGGTVTANGGDSGAGIGGGAIADGATVAIYGGTVIASGGPAFNGNFTFGYGIGGGGYSIYNTISPKAGTLTLGMGVSMIVSTDNNNWSAYDGNTRTQYMKTSFVPPEYVATPTFSPVADTYTEAQSVTISTTTEGATIYYTTDGTDPTTSSSVYSGAISVDATTTIKAIAVKEGMGDSEIASATYTIIVQTVATPTFSPVADTYTEAQSVTISTTTEGATIYYTTDGSYPTTSSSVYSGAISVDATTTIKAIAVKEGMTNSDVASATYTIELLPAGLVIDEKMPGYTMAHIDPTKLPEGVVKFRISYTLNDTPLPDWGGVYGTIAKEDWTTDVIGKSSYETGFYNFWAYYSGYITLNISDYKYFSFGGFANSTITIQFVNSSNQDVGQPYLLYTGTNLGIDVKSEANGCPFDYIVKALNFDDSNPYGWKFYNNIDDLNSMADKILNSVVHYPHGCGMHYGFVVELTDTAIDDSSSDSVSITGKLHIKNASKENNGCGVFEVGDTGSTYEFSFVIPRCDAETPTVATPTFSPVADTYTEAQSVTISTTTEGATIYYTTNGTDPTTSSSVYSGAISVDATTTIKAIAVKEGMTNSDVASATYTISKTAATVTIAPTAKTLTYNGTALELVTEGTATGGTMYYALGTDATTAPTTGWSTAIPAETNAVT